LTKEAQAKTAFVTPMGKFEFTKVPFGLTQAPGYFQRLINEVLNGAEHFAIGYLDDILIFSKTHEEHICHLKDIFTRLRRAKLKLKMEKCQFFRAEIHYLGHLISAEGIRPMPDKVASVQNIPAPKTVTEVQQFLGLANYYRKFIPRYSDIARPLTELVRKDEEFVWTDLRQCSFQTIKDALMQAPILQYPDPKKPYVLFTDASKYAWGGVLTQPHWRDDGKGNNKEYMLPIQYVSGMFRGSQLNWAALTKEAFAIYMSCKKLSFYLTNASTILRSDHKPLAKFLAKNTLNAKVNNWAVELEEFRIQFEFLEGKKNTLADAISRLIEMDPSTQNHPEPPGYEYGYFAFEPLPEIVATVEQDPPYSPISKLTEYPDLTKFAEWQRGDEHLKSIVTRLQTKDETFDGYFLRNALLYKTVSDGKQKFTPLVAPKLLVPYILRAIHDDFGHNGANRTIAMVKRYYVWPRMNQQIRDYVKKCMSCLRQNKQAFPYHHLHFKVPQVPMQFISMDLIGPFPRTASGSEYAQTAICMLTGFAFCCPIPDKTASMIVTTYLEDIASHFGGSLVILTDNGTEFKNELFAKVAKELGIKHICSPPYRPQSNGRIEGFHYFLKACSSKYVTKECEWDEVVQYACAAYNTFPNEFSRESPFFLMFGRDNLTPLSTFLVPRTRYLGDETGMLSLQALKNAHWVAVEMLNRNREKLRETLTATRGRKFESGDLVLLKNHTAKAWDPKFSEQGRVIKQLGLTKVQVQVGTKTKDVFINDIKRIPLEECLRQQVPNLSNFRRSAKLAIPMQFLRDSLAK
jgi:hypothetical protein